MYEGVQRTPMILILNVHHTRMSDIVTPDLMICDPPVPVTHYRDGFGNWCTRIVAPQGRLRISSIGLVRDTGEPDEVASGAVQQLVEDLPDETLMYLLGSRYCETDRLSQVAWELVGHLRQGGRWSRRSVISFIAISPLAMNTHIPVRRLKRCSEKDGAYAGIMPILPSRSAAE